MICLAIKVWRTAKHETSKWSAAFCSVLYGRHKFVQLGTSKDLSQQPYNLFPTADEMSDLWTSSRAGGQHWLYRRRIEHLRTMQSRGSSAPVVTRPTGSLRILVTSLRIGSAFPNDASSGAWASFAWLRRRPDFR